MMRSLFSGVAGLTTHQTRMDVIGNNIANVNTTAYKAQNMVFSDLLYQTTQAASGANATTGRGGINPRQIGLGAKTGAISTAITKQGSAQSTNNPWDVMIEGDSFFVVSDGSQNFFTRDGSFTVDAAGNLVMANLGYTVMGWQVDPATGDIRQDVVSALRVMHPDNLHSDPEATTQGYISGIMDKKDTNLNSPDGLTRTMTFFDAQGYKYTAVFSFFTTSSEDEFRVDLTDILDSDGVSLKKSYNLSDIKQIASFGGQINPNPETKLYSIPDNVTYSAADNTYSVKLALDQILTGYSDNALVVAAGNTMKVTKIGTNAAGADGTVPDIASVAKDTAVTVAGKVTLQQSQLESSPYNLIFGKDTAGNPAYYMKDPDSNQSVLVTDWEDTLDKMGMKGITLVTNPPTVNSDGSIEFDLSADFVTNQDSSYVAGNFGVVLSADPDDNQQGEILKQVFGIESGDGKTYGISYIGPDGSAQITMTENTTGYKIVFDHDTGHFSYVGSEGSNTAQLTFNPSASTLDGRTIDLGQFSNIDIDFSSITNFGNGGQCTLEMLNGSKEQSSIGAGRKEGELIGIEIGQDGKITASYDNGLTKLLGQIAVAEFANPSGLAKAGNNLYSATQNSGEFNGIGVDITANQGQMTSGYLEMSNVDLSSEFTTMITTQRGFQANSRIITVSDTLLEELVNLKR